MSFTARAGRGPLRPARVHLGAFAALPSTFPYVSDNEYDDLLILDLETTGDKPDDVIVEVGAILVTPDLQVKCEYTKVVPMPAHGWALLERIPVVREMHEASGLVDHLRRGVNLASLTEIEQEILSWYDPQALIVVAGSGVANYDVPMVRIHMPELAARMPYYCDDIGHPRRLYRMWAGRHLIKANKDKTHRALDDCRCHLDEMRAWRDLIRAHAGLPYDGYYSDLPDRPHAALTA